MHSTRKVSRESVCTWKESERKLKDPSSKISETEPTRWCAQELENASNMSFIFA
jgi:hypothetical protein